ncbi:MAG: hypothetical protein H7837_11425 [Magnetococcus sp. MYC-9]
MIAKSYAFSPDDASAASGMGHFTLSCVETDLPEGVYVYDFQLIDPSPSPPFVQTLQIGRFIITGDVTRRNSG